MKLPFTVICLNDQHRPSEIPTTHWVKKGETYTVIRIMKCHAQGGIYGYELEEINLKPFSPWEYFAVHRFAVPGDISELEEVIEEELVNE